MNEDCPAIAVNARFRQQRVTGVQRYAIEICDRIAGNTEEIVPPSTKKGGLSGHTWEQWTLPRLAKERLLWNPCATGPLLANPQVTTIYDTAFIDIPSGFSRAFRAWYQFLIPKLARRSIEIITISEFSKSCITKHWDISPSKIHVVSPAVNEKFLAEGELENAEEIQNKFSAQRPFLLAVGSISARKNFAGLLNAWRRIVAEKRLPDIDLLIVGGTASSFQSEHFGEIPASVKLLGYVSDEELQWLYRNALVFVNPSLYEGFGIPIIEAFAAGCPVVSSHTTAHREVGGTVADYFDPSDIDDMQFAIQASAEKYLSSSTRDSHRQECRNQAMKFSWDDSAKQVLEILQRAQKATS